MSSRLKVVLVASLLIGLAIASVVYAPVAPETDITGDGCLVLAYHRIVPRPWLVVDYLFGQDDFTIYEDSFREHIRSVKAAGGTFIGPQQLENIVRHRAAIPPRCVLITLDDADASVHRHAFPILKSERVPFLVFVITGQVGSAEFGGHEMATWNQLQEMAASGFVTFGSHTHDMHAMTESRQPVFTVADRFDDFARDLELSIATMEKQFGERPKYFAYPYGFGTPETDAFALASEIRLIFTLRPGIVKAGDPSFFVKRVMMTARTTRVLTEWLSR